MVAAADPSHVALTPQQWKQNRWLEGWIHTPRSTTTYSEGQKHVMANVAYPMLLNIHDTCEAGEHTHAIEFEILLASHHQSPFPPGLLASAHHTRFYSPLIINHFSLLACLHQLTTQLADDDKVPGWHHHEMHATVAMVFLMWWSLPGECCGSDYTTYV